MIKAVIMAGGSGSRLWPLSRAAHPKQFIHLNNEGTMLQNTVKRLSRLDVKSSVVICNEEHRFFVAEQLREIEKLDSIILEPVARNTAPAIGLAAFLARDEDPLLLVLAADHVVHDETSFTEAVSDAICLAESGKLVTFGIVPKDANTGYGYIKRGRSHDVGFVVDQFVEKPTSEAAEKFLESGEFFWNSGMFLFKASRYLDELKRFRPDIYQACELAVTNINSDLDFVRIDKEEFTACPSESIDYAVMEKTDDAIVVPMDAGWCDVGSWLSLWDISKKDVGGNAIVGDVILQDCCNSYVRSEDKLVAAIGVDDLVIVVTKDAVLVAHKDNAQNVKTLVQELKKRSRTEWEHHREVYRPWGKYDSIDRGERYQAKRITVNPESKLSVQMHHHRAEHWVVVSGTARVTIGDKTFILSENESTYIPIGEVHSLENPGKVPLEIIEIQSGSYLGEDDIVRFDDRYGRATR